MSHWSLFDVLAQKYNYKREHAQQLADFLLPFLRMEPKARISAQDAQHLEWLKS
jgi:serine/threonine-protein kinase SRPK3